MWKERSVLVTGGASFIGSHLVDSLLKRGAIVTVADDFSSGKLENLEYALRKRNKGTWTSRNLVARRVDLKEPTLARKMMRDIEVVFHLAAKHGGRGYIHTHPAECCTNMALDQIVFEEAWRAGVDRICFASSACVYPNYLQDESGSSYLLKEEDADPFVRDKAFADLEYGWCILGGTLILTKDGLKEVQHVEPGDFVLSKDDRWRRVAAVFRRKKSPSDHLVRIKPTRGPSVALTQEHGVWTSKGWKHAVELVGFRPGKGPLYVLPEPAPPLEKPSEKTLQFSYHGYRSEVKLTPDFYRLLGFWVAEGTLEPWTRRNAEPGYVSLGQVDRKVLDRYLETAREIDPDAKVSGPYSDGIHILRFWHHGLWKWLYRHFTLPLSRARVGGRGRRKTTPLWMSGLRREEFEAFWKGWDEGDGAHATDRSSSTVGTSSSALAGRMYTILRARNVPASLQVRMNGRFRSFRVTWLSARYANYGNVQPIALSDDDPYLYDLKIEGENSFALPGLFVHNSKLMAEMALSAYHREYGLKASSVRIFTAYGERENETHAIIALIAKALVRMDPFEIWGTGDQDRNFTYVGDIVEAMLLSAEKIENASAVNAGRADRITLNRAADSVFKLVGWRPREITHNLSKPEGVKSRAADLTRAKALLSWEPKVSYEEGFRKTIEWYRSHKDLETVRRDLPKLLMER